ncbi:electron transfer flavoprotein subunit alpha/FixB family protein [Paraburkholderia pallida]|uniref:Electron transfer flavoprotein subunit alpha/FixB family protein n=1 Tax=Paraburkholderia pallida TaxID=2547399 RepID=A0A4P7CU28_9BURK|nr:electron transfer flavoprotein subunit alpha/FixB family protein [Paraburkholderia pallida]QBQ99535.1 electron transfer flavoprotein subunit alpha/FixB family protein [Paraburkholderia pallida]
MSGILVLVEHRQGQLRPVSLEVLGAAVQAKAASGEAVTVAVLGAQPNAWVESLKLAGVDEIVTVETSTDAFDPEVYETVARALIEARKPSLVLLPHTIDTLGYAAPLAAKGNYGFTTDAFGLARDGADWLATRSGYGQKVNMEIEFPGKETTIVTLRPGAFKAPETAASPAVSTFAAPALTPRSRHLAFEEPAASGDVDIPGAEFILSVGRGIGEETHVEQFRELAETVGATLGCSRPIADSGWLPKAHQVGQSGKTAAACKMYIAMGISGSVQHMAGMKHVDNIIAVNTDPEASIFTIARYGIVGDIFDIAEELRSHF